jgi:amino acid transporter
VSEDQTSKHVRVLGVWRLAALTMAAVIGIRNLPQMAQYGWGSLFFYALATVLFFIPAALVSAELATGWPRRGGVYVWVREAFGPRAGFLAIWMQWVSVVPWYPAVLAFLAAMIAYTFNPALADNNYFVLAVVLVLLWSTTIANFLGLKVSGWISTIGVVIGSLIPAVLIIGIGFAWPALGNDIEIPFSVGSLIPDFGLQNVVFFAGLVLAFSGLELSAASASEVQDPTRNYPRAIGIAAVVILIVSVLGSLSIAFVVPHEELSLVSGIMPAVEIFFGKIGLTWVSPVVALLIAAGTIALLNTWFLAPLKGMLESAQQGDLPETCRKENRHGAPVRLLVMQALITTVASLVFLLAPDVDTAFWILSVMAIQLYLVMYILVFAAVVKLRRTHPNVERAYKIPGGSIGVWLVSVLGIVGCLYALFVGFFPPVELYITNTAGYVAILVGGMIVLGSPPLIIHYLRRER